MPRLKKKFIIFSIFFCCYQCNWLASVDNDFSKAWMYSEDISLENLMGAENGSWQTLDLPSGFSSRKFKEGFILLRKEISAHHLENILKNESQTLVLGNVSDVAYVYVNNKLIHKSGSIEPYATAFNRFLFTAIKSADLNLEAENFISILLYNRLPQVSYIAGPLIELGTSVAVLENYYYLKLVAAILTVLAVVFTIIGLSLWYFHKYQTSILFFSPFSLVTIGCCFLFFLHWNYYDSDFEFWRFFLFQSLFQLLLLGVLFFAMRKLNLLYRWHFILSNILLVAIWLLGFYFDYALYSLLKQVFKIMVFLALVLIFIELKARRDKNLSFFFRFSLAALLPILIIDIWLQVQLLEFVYLYLLISFQLSFLLEDYRQYQEEFSFLDIDEYADTQLPEGHTELKWQLTDFLRVNRKISEEEAIARVELAFSEKDQSFWQKILKESLIMGKFGLCLDLAQYLIDQTPENVAANFAKAYCLKKTMQYHEALQIALLVFQIMPRHRQNLTLIAQLYLRLNQNDNAKDFLLKALQMYPDDRRLIQLEKIA